jgi:hypothetical protein
MKLFPTAACSTLAERIIIPEYLVPEESTLILGTRDLACNREGHIRLFDQGQPTLQCEVAMACSDA